MSRNLCKRDCYFCGGEVKLTEPERLITEEDCGSIYYRSDRYAYRGAVVAFAECSDCCAKYLAWIDFSACPGYGEHPYFNRSEPFFDLSFRSTFNDEPGEADLPEHEIEVVRARKPWPVCGACGKKIYHCYGCQCPRCEEHEDCKAHPEIGRTCAEKKHEERITSAVRAAESAAVTEERR
jgi:hypothetical protein